MRWAEHVAQMGEKRNAYRMLVGKPEGKRPLRRPRRRWVDNIVTDLFKILSDSGSVNTSKYATVQGKLFSMRSAQSNSRSTGLYNPFLINVSVNTFPRIGPCYAMR
jgi:hypothetical protein